MALFVQYNPTTGAILNWYDSSYYTPPAGSSVLQVTATEYSTVQSQPGYTVVNGVLTPPSAATLLTLAKATQTQYLRSSCDTAIQNGFPAVINGTTYTVTLRQGGTNHDQTNAIMASIMAQGAIQTAKVWAPLKTVTPLHVITDGTDYWVTFAGGTTGTTQPAMPTAFSVGVMDGTVEWFKVGFRISTNQGIIIVDPVTAVSLFGQGVVFVNNMRAQYDQLKIQVEAATTVAAVQAIIWS